MSFQIEESYLGIYDQGWEKKTPTQTHDHGFSLGKKVGSYKLPKKEDRRFIPTIKNQNVFCFFKSNIRSRKQQ